MSNLLDFKKQQVRKEAYKLGWKETYYKPEKEVYGYYKDGCHLGVYIRTMEVVTILRHPRYGARTLYRKNVGLLDFINILKDPRFHTDKGYYKTKFYKKEKQY